MKKPIGVLAVLLCIALLCSCLQYRQTEELIDTLTLSPEMGALPETTEPPTTEAPTTEPTTEEPTTEAPTDGREYLGFTETGFPLFTRDGATYVETTYGEVLIANKSYTLPADYGPGDLTPECRAAFETMRAAAAAEGLSLWVRSGYRAYWTQQNLDNRYCAMDGVAAADTYSARPGHSEHQTGLAIDVNSVENEFAYTAEGKWLAAHAHEYGFIIRYAKDKEDVTGYIYEPWHVRYLGEELAAEVYDSGLCLEEFFGIDSVYAD
jgi:D-alanyl-D-alanine carboxypeptidase